MPNHRLLQSQLYHQEGLIFTPLHSQLAWLTLWYPTPWPRWTFTVLTTWSAQPKEDKWKTTFHMQCGYYKFLVMHYNLTNALASFQHFMSDVFKDPLVVYVAVYLGTILIYLEYLTAHTVHVLKLLHQPHTNNLYAKIDKCKFNVKNNVIGFIISPDSLRMDSTKVQVSLGWWP